MFQSFRNYLCHRLHSRRQCRNHFHCYHRLSKAAVSIMPRKRATNTCWLTLFSWIVDYSQSLYVNSRLSLFSFLNIQVTEMAVKCSVKSLLRPLQSIARQNTIVFLCRDCYLHSTRDRLCRGGVLIKVMTQHTTLKGLSYGLKC